MSSLPAGRQGFSSIRMKKLYVIESESSGELYVGICEDVEKRITEHKNGKNRYTKGLRPWKLLLVEEYNDWKEAREKEKFYKSGFGKEKLKEKLKKLKNSQAS